MDSTPFSASPSRSSSARAFGSLGSATPSPPRQAPLELPVDPRPHPRPLTRCLAFPQLDHTLGSSQPGGPRRQSRRVTQGARSFGPLGSTPCSRSRAPSPSDPGAENRGDWAEAWAPGDPPAQFCPSIPRGREIVFLANCQEEKINKRKDRDRRKVTARLFKRGAEKRNQCESPWGLPRPSINRLPSCCS